MNILVTDIGGTAVKYAEMTDDLQILSKDKIPTPLTSQEDLIDALAKIYSEFPDVEGMAISMPGIIDSEKGYCKMGGALRYNDDSYFRDELRKKIPVNITIENDAKCAAMAEAAVGSLKDVADGFVMIFGTAVGGGYIKNHKLHKGAHFSAGEISAMITDRNGTPAMDGIFGNRCGTPRLCKMYANAKKIPDDEVDGVIFFNALNDGDEVAAICLDTFTKEIAVQIFNLQAILDPQRFAIGGGISAQPVFVEKIRENLEKLYKVFPLYTPQAEIVTCQFQNDANLIGALQCYLAQHC